jgi:hypothetical protein
MPDPAYLRDRAHRFRDLARHAADATHRDFLLNRATASERDADSAETAVQRHVAAEACPFAARRCAAD